MYYNMLYYSIRSYHSISCPVMSCHVLSCHVMPCHVVSYHMISSHLRGSRRRIAAGEEAAHARGGTWPSARVTPCFQDMSHKTCQTYSLCHPTSMNTMMWDDP